MPATIDGKKLENYLGASLITAATTMMALPSIAVPCGFDRYGRPVGLQMVGRHRGEAELLQAAVLFEQMMGLSLYGAFFVKEFAERQFCCLSSVSFVRSQSPFLRPDPRLADVVARRSCQGWPSAPTLRHAPSLPRPYLDSLEHDGRLGAIGMTIRGVPAFGRGSVAPQPCIRWVQGPEP
jgi:hypothetical protein